MGSLVDWVKKQLGVKLEVIKRNDDAKSFEVLPKRWIVERTLGWIGRNRRLSKDKERQYETEECWVHLAMIYFMLKRFVSFQDAA